jgi:hypothetical protein
MNVSMEWVPKFDLPTEWVALFLTVISFASSVLCFVSLLRGWLKIPSIHRMLIAIHAVNLIQLLLSIGHAYFWRQNVFVTVSTVSSSLLLTLFFVLSQMEFLKIFSILSEFWSVKKVIWLQISAVALHFILCTGHYVHTGIRTGGDNSLQTWSQIGLRVWLVMAVLSENILVFYQTWLLYRHVKSDSNVLVEDANHKEVETCNHKSKDNSTRRKFIRLQLLLFSITFLDVLGVLMNCMDLIFPDSLSDGTRPGRLGYSFMQITIPIVAFHCVAVTLMFHYVIEFKFGRRYVDMRKNDSTAVLVEKNNQVTEVSIAPIPTFDDSVAPPTAVWDFSEQSVVETQSKL